MNIRNIREAFDSSVEPWRSEHQDDTVPHPYSEQRRKQAEESLDQDTLPREPPKPHDGALIAAAWAGGAFVVTCALIGVGRGIAALFNWGGA